MTETDSTRTPIVSPFIDLLHSRKFLLLVLDTAISLALYFHAVDPAFIAIIQPVFVFAIGSIAYEDGKAKAAPVMVQAEKVDTVAGTVEGGQS